ncbi:tetratricopeptide repeat protein [Desulfobulbus alkaliphilus]|uniref:tetratricopeptide repeat protein n=1 Tax=Desulfobulbus alkaliphilus TaxID=869814 RepID=UPI001964FCEB|nr:tetratricopeptide repeat protein [Desulfobulbus alkaliphilus]MBM9537959.1 tetratricopeptide repeat protein [Desulfobulbus alkaliphilus]
MVSREDLHVLRVPLTREIQRSLPVPGTVHFFCCEDQHQNESGSVQPSLGGTEAPTSSMDNGGVDLLSAQGQCIASLPLTSGAFAAVILGDVDSMLEKKSTSDWVHQMRIILPERLEAIRLGYVDPETGLYNRRVAEEFLKNHDESETGIFFLVSTIFPRRSARGNLQKLKEMATLLPVLTGGFCFSFGCGVFGVFLGNVSKDVALQRGAYLQHRLKREGIRKVQMGFVALTGSAGKPDSDLLARCWHSLAEAEKKGPFGMHDADDETRHPLPFHVSHPDLLGSLKKQWRGLNGFTLAVLSGSPEVIADIFLVDSGVRDVVENVGICCGGSNNRGLFFFPEVPWATIQACIDEVHLLCREKYGDSEIAIGVASWPCLDFAKKDVPGNCLKALAHGSLLHPGSVVVFDHLSLNVSGDLFFEEGDYRSAIREYRRGLLLEPCDINLLNSLGVALAEFNQAGQAAECFLEVLRTDPDNYMALVNLGYVHQSRRKKEAALVCFERAYALMPREERTGQELFLSLSRLYNELGQYEQAVALLEQWQGVAGSEKEYLLFRLLGQGYWETGRPEKAIVACQRALQLFPRDSVSLSMLGVLYVEQGEGHEVGLSLCQRALAQDPFHPDHWCRLGRALLFLGNHGEALDAIRQGLRIKRNHVEGHLLLGVLFLAQKRYAQARKYFLRVINMKDATARQRERARQYGTQSGQAGNL